MKTLSIEIDPATLTNSQRGALATLNHTYTHGRHGVIGIENTTVQGEAMVVYNVEVDEESPTFEGDAFFREDFLCGIMDVLDDYK